MNLRQDAFLDDRYIARGLAWDYQDGEELPRHNHSWAQLVYAETGVMQVETEDVGWLVPTTRAIWIPGDVTHWIRMRGEVRMRSFYLATHLDQLPGECIALEVTPLLRELILYLVGLTWLEPGDDRHERLVLMLADLINESRDVPLGLPMPQDPRARLMASRVLAEPGARRPLEDLADGCGASLRTLQRIFKAETGLSLDLWRARARMQDAIVRLNAGETVTEIAFATGYGSPSAFTHAFKRLLGVTPSRYSHAAGSSTSSR